MSVQEYVKELAASAKRASAQVASSPVSVRDSALDAVAEQIQLQRGCLLEANHLDLANASTTGLDSALVDRLELNEGRIDAMLESLAVVRALPDPIGGIEDLRFMTSGIQVGKMRVPLGLIGIIYESRPNVTVDAASLCLKSGNAVLLRGGSEAIESNRVLATCIRAGLTRAGLPPEAVQVLDTTDRDAVSAMVTLSGVIDMVVPRGGKGLIERVARDATVPVLKHLDGVCHLYIHADADVKMAIDLAINAKTHRYGTCNTMESLLIDQDVATLIPDLAASLLERGVELRGCPRVQRILGDACIAASDADWGTEYLAPILSLKLVENFQEAVDHIAKYGSGHTDGIVTNCHATAMRFLRVVDSSSVMVNTSTRFADGFEYGLGAEIGISTDKIHARGPVGLAGLTSQKYVVLGNGHIRR
ncbi:MAG: glutamate-5-semialdehyde dehydrogenase [Pseudomonadales bacterium]|nr:glutamate-5-semialdehyde dehydrogenase [Pseudomonadales bacterium]